ncbi:MAG: flippase-like domain-containing protein [Lachnospiraceae bacterium]|nr:flippase-like domain-containing protein [Lachnospiraceae bacterium]
MKNKKTILNLLFLLLVFALTLYYVFHGEDMGALAAYLKQADVRYWIAGTVLVVIFILSESVIIYYMMRSVGQPVILTHCFLYSFVGFFFSAITPSATGGQPAQLYFMKKDRLSISISTLILMVVTITYKAVLVVMGLAVVIFRPPVIMRYLNPVIGWCYLGVALNVFCVAFMMILVFHPTLAENILVSLIKVFCRITHSKKEKRWIQRISGAMEKYRSVADYLRKNKRVIVNVLLITFVQRIIWFFITYLVYLSFSLQGVDAVTITTLQGMISVSVDMLPLPGGMGMSETLFLSIFRPICGKDFVLPVMVVSRGISYYTQLIISAIMTGAAYLTIGGAGKKDG